MNIKPRAFWRGNELPIADLLRSYQTALRDDFMKGFDTLEEAVKSRLKPQAAVVDGRTYDNTPMLTKTVNPATGEYEPDASGWQVGPLKYERHDDVMDFSFSISEEEGKAWPTAYSLIKHFGDDCQCSAYSVLTPNSKIDRHTGPENRTGEFIRIHIPLIIPEGDVYLEALDEEVTWEDVWGFNNQLAHSAHNNTNEYRLVFLIDLRRTAIGLDAGVPYDPAFGAEVVGPFVRKK